MCNYEIRVFPLKAEDGSTYWTAKYPAVEGCVGGGDTPEEAIAEAQENLELLLEYLKDEKKKIPAEYSQPEYNGKISLRVSKSVHKKVSEIAEQEGISINTFLNTAISHFLGIKEYEFKLDQKVDKIKTITGESFAAQLSTNYMVKDMWDSLDVSQKNPWYVTVNAGGYDE